MLGASFISFDTISSLHEPNHVNIYDKVMFRKMIMTS